MPPSSSQSSDQAAALKRMLKLINSLLSRSDSTPFSEPVDWRGLELWDYPKIVKKMMDLGTVKRKLERGLYKNHVECAEDVRLIWHNCQLYNEQGSDFWHLSKTFSKKFEDRYKKIQAEFGDAMQVDTLANNKSAGASKSSAPTTKISMDRKSKFSSQIFRLNGMELGHVIRTIEVSCPEALEDIVVGATTPQVEINVDAISTETFIELEGYLHEKVPHRKRKA